MLVRKHEDLAVKHEKSVEELKGAKDVICKHEEESKLLRSLLERRVSSRDQHRSSEVKNDREAKCKQFLHFSSIFLLEKYLDYRQRSASEEQENLCPRS